MPSPEERDCPNALDCKETFARLDDYLHRELTPADLVQVELHLTRCAHCAEIFEFEQSLVECVKKKLDALQVPCDLAERIKRALDTTS